MAETFDNPLERYQIMDPLGQGGSGRTFRAVDRSLGRQVAIKALSLEVFERTFTVTAALNVLTLLVAGFAIAFICTSVALTIVAAQKSSTSSVLDRITDTQVTEPEPEGTLPAGEDLLPPTSDDTPLVPRAD